MTTVQTHPHTGQAGPRRGGRTRATLALALPLLGVALLALTLQAADPGAVFANDAPPVEEIAFESIRLTPGVIDVTIRNAGPDPVTVAQVLVDDAYWTYTIEPSNTLDRLDTATVHLEYPWVEGETHALLILTDSGATFEEEIAVATTTPGTGAFVVPGLFLGLVVGVLPVAVGMLALPFLREAGARVRTFILAFTVGLLAFLGSDALFEGMEIAEHVAGNLNGEGLLVLSAIVATLAILLVDRGVRARAPSAARNPALVLAYLVAFAIGVHNFGEGLAIAGAYAAGEAALGSALILGFALHNVTEGPAVVGPLARGGTRAAWGHLAGLAALAGAPLVLGAWLGAAAVAPAFQVIALGVGVGAIAVVVWQVADSLRRDVPATSGNPVALGVLAGVVVMYLTGLIA